MTHVGAFVWILAASLTPILADPPRWIRGDIVTDQPKAVIEILKNADAKGLNSKDYDGLRWADRLAFLLSRLA
jgi:hypothetical protein